MGDVAKMKPFRHWCHEMWCQHVDEYIAWEGFEPTSTPQEYFNKYKFWLKREYKYQHNLLQKSRA